MNIEAKAKIVYGCKLQNEDDVKVLKSAMSRFKKENPSFNHTLYCDSFDNENEEVSYVVGFFVPGSQLVTYYSFTEVSKIEMFKEEDVKLFKRFFEIANQELKPDFLMFLSCT